MSYIALVITQNIRSRHGRLDDGPYWKSNMCQNESWEKHVETVSKVLRDYKSAKKHSIPVYKCLKCERILSKEYATCPDKVCNGSVVFWRSIPADKVADMTSRRAARQCPSCMKTFKPWVEICPRCSVPAIKGKVVKSDSEIARIYGHSSMPISV